MRLFHALLTALFLFAAVHPVSAGIPNPSDDLLKNEAQQGLGEILDLWRGGDIEALYKRSIATGKQKKAGFISRLSTTPTKPACCWEKMQDVTIYIVSNNTVNIHAKLGLEEAGNTEFVTKTIKMIKEDGVWKMTQTDIFSLASKPKKVARHKVKTVQHHKTKIVKQ